MIKIDHSKIEDLEAYLNRAVERSHELFFLGKDKTEEEVKELEYLHTLIDEMSKFYRVTIPHRS